MTSAPPTRTFRSPAPTSKAKELCSSRMPCIAAFPCTIRPRSLFSLTSSACGPRREAGRARRLAARNGFRRLHRDGPRDGMLRRLDGLRPGDPRGTAVPRPAIMANISAFAPMLSPVSCSFIVHSICLRPSSTVSFAYGGEVGFGGQSAIVPCCAAANACHAENECIRSGGGPQKPAGRGPSKAASVVSR